MFLYILYSFYHEVSGRVDQTRKGIFLLYWTQNSVCFERSFGLKRRDENFSSISEKERAHSLALVGRPWPSQFLVAHSRLCPTQSAPPLASRRWEQWNIYSLSLCWYAHVCYRTSDSILTLVIRSSYAQLGCFRRLLPAKGPWKHLVLRS